MYAIIDIETTGGNASRERITEIAIFIHDGTKVVNEYSTLINPECTVPPFVARLTGISNEMLADAPKFFEVARDIVEITEGCTFVAHNAAFDYSFVKQEFLNLGYKYKRPVLCTVKMSHKLLPGHKSYSLGNLCNSLGIQITSRHRASGDALATVRLFERLLSVDPTLSQIPTDGLHSSLDRSIFSRLPSSAGVYYFHDENGKLLYIGKSKNIHARVLAHFQNSSSNRAIEMRSNTASISYIETGSELIALLLESDEIKKHKPLHNRLQRRTLYKYGLYSFKTQAGYHVIQIEKIKTTGKPHTVFSSFDEALVLVHEIVAKYNLCQKLCSLYQNHGACFQHSIGQCSGACIGLEPAESYNLRVEAALAEFQHKWSDMAIIDHGRNEDELSVVLIENNVFAGFGWMNKEDRIEDPIQIRDNIKRYNDNRDIQQIIKGFLNSGKALKIVRF
ncbi:MAG: exonuclease domain-containing protein [Lentimicrobiaceae bacterium]